ncbi:germination protein YpeB [Paenibacillus yanchengensis]|uniref:Germination protein YpeB n=1 Tax=Paenibacillus yanchengensis TaxID=2035833 RepID=A0ABW4YJS1_9BACL
MYKRISAVMFPITLLLLVGFIFWGVQQYQAKQAVLIKAENQYQRAFNDLTFHMGKLNKQLGETLAVHTSSNGHQRKALVNVWRLSGEAQTEVSQLPLSYLPFSDAEQFLSRISNFAYKASVRDLLKQPLTDQEFKTLQTLHEKSQEISQDLSKMQQEVLDNNLRWMDIEMAIAKEDAAQGNLVVDGLLDIDKKIGEYPELDWGPSVMSMYEQKSFKALSDHYVSPEEVKSKAVDMFGWDKSKIKIEENGVDSEYASYVVTYATSDEKKYVRAQFARQGGHLLFYMNDREVKEEKLQLEEVKNAADKLLEKLEFKNMKAISYDKFSNSGTFTYVGSQNGVLLYPEKIVVEMALDNGDLLSMQSREYVQEHQKERKLPEPKISSADARKVLHPKMAVEVERLAVIKGESGEEVLCYEFTGKINDTIYRIYINAETAIEEAIEQMSREDKHVTTALGQVMGQK